MIFSMSQSGTCVVFPLASFICYLRDKENLIMASAPVASTPATPGTSSSTFRVTRVFQSQNPRPHSFRPDLNETDQRRIVTLEKTLRSERRQEAHESCSLLSHLYAPADAEVVDGVGMPLESSEAKKLEQNLLFLLRTNAAEALRFRKSRIRRRMSEARLMSLTLQATSTYFATLIRDFSVLFDKIPQAQTGTMATGTSPPVENTMMKLYRHCKHQMLQLHLWQDMSSGK